MSFLPLDSRFGSCSSFPSTCTFLPTHTFLSVLRQEPDQGSNEGSAGFIFVPWGAKGSQPEWQGSYMWYSPLLLLRRRVSPTLSPCVPICSISPPLNPTDETGHRRLTNSVRDLCCAFSFRRPSSDLLFVLLENEYNEAHAASS